MKGRIVKIVTVVISLVAMVYSISTYLNIRLNGELLAQRIEAVKTIAPNSDPFACKFNGVFYCDLKLPRGVVKVQNAVSTYVDGALRIEASPFTGDYYLPSDGEVCNSWTWVSTGGDVQMGTGGPKGAVVYLAIDCQNHKYVSYLNPIGVVVEGDYQ